MAEKGEENTDYVDARGITLPTLDSVKKLVKKKVGKKGLETKEEEEEGFVKDFESLSVSGSTQESSKTEESKGVASHSSGVSTKEGVGENVQDATDASGNDELDPKTKAMDLLDALMSAHRRRSHSAYNMDHKRRGSAVIFNMGVFEQPTGLPPRKGYLLDGFMMEEVLSNLGFEIRYHQDLATKEINQVLDQVAVEPHKDEDCFVCVIMTHGEPSPQGRDIIYSTSGPMVLQTIVERFNAINCPSLAGKPKLFLVQACRGRETDEGAIVEIETDAGPAKTKVIPIESDILLSQSVVPGYFSFRNGEKGSVYIRYLACALGLHGTERDIHWILTEVNSLVANEFTSNAVKTLYHQKKQMPVFTSMLTKQLILKMKKKTDEK